MFCRAKAYILITHLDSFGLQIAVASGATVIVTSSSDKKLKIAKKLGAHHLINYSTTPDWHEEVLRLVRPFAFCSSRC